MARPLQNSQKSSAGLHSGQPSGLIHVCMYCSVVMGSQPQYCLLHEPANTTTHGACVSCTRRFLRELERGVRSPLLDLIYLRRMHIFGVPYDPYLHRDLREGATR